MKKFLLSTTISAIALMALNTNATSLTNFGALTISWTTLQQTEAITNTSTKPGSHTKTATNTVYDYKATTKSSSFGNASLLGLLNISFSNAFTATDKLATDGENIYVVDKTGSTVVTNISSVLTVSYVDSVTSGAATVTTNLAESAPVTTITTNTNVISALGTNVTLVTNVSEMTNYTYMTNVTTISTNIDTITTTNSTNIYTTYTYSTNVVDIGTNYSAITNIVISGTNYTTNIDEIVSGTNITYTTNVVPVFTYSNMVVPITTNVVSVTNTVYTTNFTYITNVVDTKDTASGTASYTTTSYFTLVYSDSTNGTVFIYHGLASTAIDVNIAKDTGTENFSVKDGVGSGTIGGKTTLISGTIAGAAKGAASAPAE